MLRRWYWYTFVAARLGAIGNAAGSGRRARGGRWQWLVALAGVILLSGLAGAQTVTCSAAVAVAPTLRAEGLSELIGDILLTCVGGAAPTIGQPLPTATIAVDLGTNVTSRLLNTSVSPMVSEALLLIDDPGSGSVPPAPGTGSQAPQTLCSSASAGAGTGGCVQFPVSDGNAVVMSSSPTSLTAPANIYQGTWDPAAPNQIVFTNVPILAPVESGAKRTYRITNIRANVAGLTVSASNPSAQQLNASVSIVSGLIQPVTLVEPPPPGLIAGLILTSLSVATLNPAGTGSLTPPAFASCIAETSITPTAILQFSETFATAWKTRVLPGPNYNGQGEFFSGSTYAQNIPGTIYNSESGFILNTPINGGTAGLADYGTRLKATFHGVPAGVRMFVSVTNVNNAVLVSGETAGDGSSPASFPAVAATTTVGGVPVAELAVDATGTAVAVWEVTLSNPAVLETDSFVVYQLITASTPTDVTVNLSYGPTPPAGASAAVLADWGLASGTLTLPRFADDSLPMSLFSLGPCFTIVEGYPVSLTSTATPDQVSPQSSPSGEPYTVTITQGTGGPWLTATPASGTTGSTSFLLGVSAGANTLPPGQYTASATVTVVTSENTIAAGLNVLAEANLTAPGSPALSGGAFSLGPHFIQFTTPGTQVLNVATLSLSTGAPATPSSFTVTNAPNANTPAGLLIINGTQPFTTTGTTTTVPVTITYSAAVANSLPPGAYGGTVTVAVTQAGTTTSPQFISIPWTLLIEASITPASLPNGQVGVAYSAQVAGHFGVAPYTWLASGLPPGVTLAGSTGALSGTPTTAGPFNITVTATDSTGAKASQTYPVTIAPPPLTITTSSLPNGTIGIPYTAPLAASGGVPPYTWSANGLPGGLAVSGASITGTPTASGSFTVGVTVTDSTKVATASQSFTVIIVAPPTISSLVPPFVVAGGSAFNLTVNGANFVEWLGDRVWRDGADHHVCEFQQPNRASERRSGGQGREYRRRGNGPRQLRWRLVRPGQLPGLQQAHDSDHVAGPRPDGHALQLHPACQRGLPPYTWSVVGLPSGLTLNPATGVISGTWTAAASYSLTIFVTDNSGQTMSTQYTVAVSNPTVPLQITTPSPLPPATVGTAYGLSFSASGGTAPYTFTLVGTAPPGLVYTSGGLGGTPTTAGQFSFTISVTDSASGTASKGFTLVVAPGPLTIITASLPNGQVGVAYSAQVAASGGVQPYRFSVSGLPGGVTGSANGSIAGTPTAAGSFSVTVTATDSAGTTASKSFTITVTVPPLTITGSLPNGQVGVAYSGQVAGAGGVPPLTLQITGLPAGLTSSSGAISGTPTAAGSFSVSVTVTDSATPANQKSQSFPVTIAPAPLTVTTTSLPNGMVGTAYSASLAASGGVPPYTWAASGLPGGLTVSGASIAGTPTANGNFNVGVTVTDSKGATASASLGLTIAAAPLVITASLSAGVVGTAISTTLTASGGVPPYTWSTSGLPAGVTESAGGVLSGTPTAPGSFSVSVTVTDSAGTSTSGSLSWTIGLPPAPPLTFTGLSSTSSSFSQSTLQVNLGSAYPVAVTVNLTMTFTPTSGADDPAVGFSIGSCVPLVKDCSRAGRLSASHHHHHGARGTDRRSHLGRRANRNRGGHHYDYGAVGGGGPDHHAGFPARPDDPDPH